MQESKTRQASQASRAADFSTHECNASDEEFIILSRFELEIFFYFLQAAAAAAPVFPLQTPSLVNRQTFMTKDDNM